MKIIEFIADSSLSGGPKHVLDIVKGFEAENYSITVISPPGWLPDKIGANNLAQMKPIEIPSAFDKKAIAQIKQIIEEIKPDLVHAHGTRAGILAAKILAKNSVPLIYTEHRWTKDFKLRNPLRQWLQLRALRQVGRKASVVIGVSEAVSKFLIESKISLPEKTITIHNGIDLPVVIKTHAATEMPVIGSIGSLIPVKNYPLLIDAFALINQAFPKARLEIIGEGNQLTELQEQVGRLGLTEKVIFLGRVENIEVKLLEWDIFTSTSTTESFGLAIAEAMAAGLPVVATNYAAAKELVTDDVGFRVDFKVADITKAVIRLLWEDDLRSRLGEAARRRIEVNFSRTKMIRELNKLYQSLISH